MLVKQFNQELIHCSNILSFFFKLATNTSNLSFLSSNARELYDWTDIQRYNMMKRLTVFLINFSGNVFNESMSSITVES